MKIVMIGLFILAGTYAQAASVEELEASTLCDQVKINGIDLKTKEIEYTVVESNGSSESCPNCEKEQRSGTAHAISASEKCSSKPGAFQKAAKGCTYEIEIPVAPGKKVNCKVKSDGTQTWAEY